MSTTLEPAFLAAILTMTAFKHTQMTAAQAGLIYLALTGEDFTAAELDANITGGSAHVAGAATGSLASLGFITCVGRVKSPNPAAKGRRLDVWRIVPAKRSTALTWLDRHALPRPAQKQTAQLEMAI